MHQDLLTTISHYHITSLHCPLCATPTPIFYHCDRTGIYWQCSHCALVFVPPTAHLDTVAEKAIYDLHENEPADLGYRRFLSRLTIPLLTRLTRGDHGLDFGCGPGPALAQMLREAGMAMQLYDTFYAPNKAVWNERYDFITATEVVEHLYHPAREWERRRHDNGQTTIALSPCTRVGTTLCYP